MHRFVPIIIIHVPFLNVAGMALFPFILVGERHYKYDKVLINHEKIHLIQQLETLIIPFYILYLMNYFLNLLKYKEHHTAYMNMYFEREAYKHEQDLNYLHKRKVWSFIKYL